MLQLTFEQMSSRKNPPDDVPANGADTSSWDQKCISSTTWYPYLPVAFTTVKSSSMIN